MLENVYVVAGIAIAAGMAIALVISFFEKNDPSWHSDIQRMVFGAVFLVSGIGFFLTHQRPSEIYGFAVVVAAIPITFNIPGGMFSIFESIRERRMRKMPPWLQRYDAEMELWLMGRDRKR